MPTRRLTGSRIREKRLDQGLRQAAVADAVGISASYLNLIEHNRRRIGGKLLSDIARILGVDPSLLTEGADSDLLDQMRSAAAASDDGVEIARTEELAARYPGWSRLITSQARRLGELEERVQVMQDRMAHDPELADALHDVISAVTSIRSSSAILTGQEELDADWQRRFHENIHSDSIRLAARSEALITYLEKPDMDLDTSNSPRAALEAFLAVTGHHLADLENSKPDVASVVAGSGLNGSAADLLRDFAIRYSADAELMPLTAFSKASEAAKYDPIALAGQFNAPLDAVLRRISTLPANAGHPPTGLVICDSSGTIVLAKSVPGFVWPRTGGACPLWPVFGALSRPTQPVRQEVVLPGAPEPRFLSYAIAVPISTPRYDAPPVLQSTALLMPDPPQGTDHPVELGISCHICPRPACNSRREAPIAGVALQSAL
ncbi:short-chain fatty acyl-CoA regulator family protein [Yoonia sp. BS5-3]|uniref:Short-chain fatty acyl-CoA regulator family protein n=1 Tax=Yoonia phaeophyticola TaxID=3137369 RepID=A0ABZ2V1K8_9RHOB